jgi:hypothetical protein
MKSSESRRNGEKRTFLATNKKAATADDEEDWRDAFVIPAATIP